MLFNGFKVGKMTFKLDTTKNFYTEKEKTKLEILGFSFEEQKDSKDKDRWYKEDVDISIEIKDLEELIHLLKNFSEDERIVLSEKRIELYDGYRE